MADEKEPLTKAMERAMEKDESKPKMNCWKKTIIFIVIILVMVVIAVPLVIVFGKKGV